MRSYQGLDHLIVVAFMGTVSCSTGQGQELKGSSEVVRPYYPQVPEFPMADPTTRGVAPNTAIYPALQKPETVVSQPVTPVPVVAPLYNIALVATPVETTRAPSTPAPHYGNVQSFHADIIQPQGAERDSVLSHARAWELHNSTELLRTDSLKPGIYEVRDGSLTRFLVVEEGGVVVGTMSLK